MANGRQATAKRLKMAERSKQQMDLHFPGFHQSWIWHRKTNDGFTTVPRTMPIIMQAIDVQSKGQPAGHTLFCLWARSPDNPVIVIENPATFAAEAGFMGERAVPAGEFHYVLLLNPNAAMEWMRSQKMVQDGIYSRFVDRLMEVGAFGELEAVHEFWNAQAAASAAAAEVAAASKEIPAPPAAG